MAVDSDLEFEHTLVRVKPVGRTVTFQTGEIFAGRYEVRALLGEGGMGAVYKVFDREVEEMIALKVLLGQAAKNADAVERFRREVRLARRVTHRNAARTYDLGDHDGVRFLTMEYVNGRSLSDVLQKRGVLGVGCAASTTAEICEGLAAAHAAGVIHRDLKPANVLVEMTGRVVLTDFGIARALQGSEVTLDSTGLMGTPAYMAPEQVSGGEVGPHTDIYAAGMILYESLTGRLPFRGENAIAMAVARLNEEPSDPRTFVEMPDGLALLILQCLSREPGARPASASELGAMLRGFASGESPPEVAALTRVTTGRLSGVTGTSTTPHSRDRRWTAALPSERSLAVLPFRFRGKQEDAYLAEALTDELVDILSRTRGLRVTGSGATAKYAGRQDRDPRTVGEELGVDVLVDGSVQMAGKRVRITARLEDVSNGFQLWSDRFDGLLEDVFELQDRMAKRIAEALRVELSNLIYRGEAPAEAVELYLRARQNIKSLQLVKDNVDFVEMLEKCLELAPGFKPAIATHALGCLREWFAPFHDDERDWGAMTRKSVQRALDQAPELADTHFASARMSVQLGEYRKAAQGLAKALEIAPTCAEYHEYLGRLQCEAGRTKTGVRHILLAHELDPSLTMGVIDLARTHALRGEWEAYNKILREIRTRMGTHSVAAQLTQTRIASWTRDVDTIRDVLDNIPEGASSRIFLHCQALLCSPTALKEFLELGESLTKRPDANLRFLTVTYQMGAEVMAFHRKPERALEFISRAADAVLVDIDWMTRCPLFDEIRETPEFRSAAQKVRHRAEAIWRVSVEMPALAAG